MFGRALSQLASWEEASFVSIPSLGWVICGVPSIFTGHPYNSYYTLDEAVK